MSIKDNLLKIKSFVDIVYNIKKRHISRLFLAFFIILVAISCFGLGRLSALRNARTPITLGIINELSAADIKNTPSNVSVTTTSINNEGIVVASKQGKIYHFPWCSGAKRISAENKITFSSRTEAEKAGYAPAKNCKGLIVDSK